MEKLTDDDLKRYFDLPNFGELSHFLKDPQCLPLYLYRVLRYLCKRIIDVSEMEAYADGNFPSKVLSLQKLVVSNPNLYYSPSLWVYLRAIPQDLGARKFLKENRTKEENIRWVDMLVSMVENPVFDLWSVEHPEFQVETLFWLFAGTVAVHYKKTGDSDRCYRFHKIWWKGRSLAVKRGKARRLLTKIRAPFDC